VPAPRRDRGGLAIEEQHNGFPGRALGCPMAAAAPGLPAPSIAARVLVRRSSRHLRLLADAAAWAECLSHPLSRVLVKLARLPGAVDAAIRVAGPSGQHAEIAVLIIGAEELDPGRDSSVEDLVAAACAAFGSRVVVLISATAVATLPLQTAQAIAACSCVCSSAPRLFHPSSRHAVVTESASAAMRCFDPALDTPLRETRARLLEAQAVGTPSDHASEALVASCAGHSGPRGVSEFAMQMLASHRTVAAAVSAGCAPGFLNA